jgi:large subunit ribosomal protein L23
MNILKRFKKTEKKEKEKLEEKPIEKKETPAPVDVKKEAPKVTPQVKSHGVLSSLVLRKPHVSEKATTLGDKSIYVFEIAADANKIDVKRAVEGFYGVNVVKVNIINIKGKERRLGRIAGRTPGYKKALVKLSPGQTIEVLPK